MGEGTDRPAGERRRRREAERAAARAAETTGASRPLTRRELRWQQAEEAARLEAIATGELRLPIGTAEPLTPPQEPSAGQPDAPVPDPSVAAAPAAAAAGSAQPAGPGSSAPSAVTAPSPPSAASAQPVTSAGSVPSAPSAGSAQSPPSAGSAQPDPTPSAPSADTAPTRLPSAGSASSTPSPAGADSGAPGVPSRRSLRERAPQEVAAPPESPQERTATGRRPVVRTPSTARGVRSLDSTGQLTGIQPVVRPDSAPQDAPVWSERATFSLDTPAREVVPEPPRPESADDVDEDEDEDDYLARPRWVALDGATVGSGESAAAAPSRRSLRAPVPDEVDDGSEPAEADEDERSHPALTLVKVAVLVIVAAVLGALIWLLATDAFDDDSSAAAPHQTITTPHLEETSAR